MHLQRSKSTLVSLATVFWMQRNVEQSKKVFSMHLGGNRRWVPLKLQLQRQLKLYD